jgi:3-(3-hydroxy-phenyl)propionate hydroxylase
LDLLGHARSGRLAEPFWYAGSPLTTPDPSRAMPVRPPRGSSPVPAPARSCPAWRLRPRRLRTLARSGFLLLTDLALPSARGVAVLPVRFPSDLAEALGAKPGEIWIVRPDAHVAAVLSTPDDLPAALRRACGW